MNTENKQQELYISPVVKLIEIKARQAMCTSATWCVFADFG